MAEALIVYFSLTGNTKMIAETIAGATGADILPLELARPLPKGGLRYFVGGMQVFLGIKPKLSPLSKKPGDYDLIFIGTPVWASRLASPLRSFFSSCIFTAKKVALFVCSADPSGGALPELRDALVENDVIGEIEFGNPLERDAQEAQAKAQAWAQEMVSRV